MKREYRSALAAATLLMIATQAWAGRPLAIDDADPVDPGHVEIEAGAAYVHDPSCDHWDIPFGITHGVRPALEAGIGFGGQFEERRDILEGGGEDCEREHGLNDLVIGAKWQFLPTCPLGARHALAPAVKLPTADEDRELGSGETDYDLTWIASRGLGEKAGVHANLGYSWIGGPDRDLVHYGVALDYALADALQWVVEIFAERERDAGADTSAAWNTGLRWMPAEGLTLDLAGGSRFLGDAPDFTATAGLTWAFGLRAQGMP